MARAHERAHGHARTARACTRERSAQRGWAAAGACVEATPKGVLFVRRHRGGEVDREGAGRGHSASGRARTHGAYSVRRVRTIGLCSGLGVVLSAMAASPAEHAM
jgi:hypothetical protein